MRLRPKDAEEMQRFGELLTLCRNQLLALADELHKPERPQSSVGGEAVKEWRGEMVRYHATREGLHMAALRVEEIHTGLRAALR